MDNSQKSRKLSFKEIYSQSIKFWPSEIDISDGTITDIDSGKFPMLSESWNKAELKTENESEFIQLMVWGIYCAYHKKAIEKFQNKETSVSLTEIDTEYLRYKFEESLFNKETDYYKELRSEYKTD